MIEWEKVNCLARPAAWARMVRQGRHEWQAERIGISMQHFEACRPEIWHREEPSSSKLELEVEGTCQPVDMTQEIVTCCTIRALMIPVLN